MEMLENLLMAKRQIFKGLIFCFGIMDKQTEYQKEYYRKNKDRVLKRNKEHYIKNRDRIKLRYIKYHQKIKQDFLLTYKIEKCCSFCGYKEHPEILQFHHKDKKDKSFTIGNTKKNPTKAIKEEIEKCFLLCPNCHFLLHFKEKNKGIIK